MNTIELKEVPYLEDQVYRIEGKNFPKRSRDQSLERVPIFIKFYERLNLDLSIYDDPKNWNDETEIVDASREIIKVFPVFKEVFIDDIPLSYHLDFMFENKTPLLYNFVGTLGNSFSIAYEKLLLKQLLNMPIGKDEIIKLFYPSKEILAKEKEMMLEDNWEFQDMVQEIAAGIIGIYSCPRCQSRECGGYHFTISEDENAFSWIINAESKNIRNLAFNKLDKCLPLHQRFTFEKATYLKIFKSYLEQLEKKND